MRGRIGQLYFDLGKGNSLVVSGGTVYSGLDTALSATSRQPARKSRLRLRSNCRQLSISFCEKRTRRATSCSGGAKAILRGWSLYFRRGDKDRSRGPA
jgi:hypothetical protein